MYDNEWRLRSLPTRDRLPGPPLSYESAVTTLLAKGVNVAIGVVDEYTARNTRFDLAWVNNFSLEFTSPKKTNFLHIFPYSYRLLWNPTEISAKRKPLLWLRLISRRR